MDPEFHYQPLATNELRVLTVLPCLGPRRDEPLRCSLEHVSLEDFTPEYRTWEEETGHSLKLRPHKARLGWAEYTKSRPADPNDRSLLGHNGVPDAVHNAARYAWGDFVALSYCWGSDDPESSRRIVLNDRSFRVTENLHAALDFVRMSGDSTNIIPLHTPLWVDAICINQADENEKRREIRRMKDIYGHSIGVLVHLGCEEADSSHGIDILQQIATEVAQGIDRGEDLFRSRTEGNEAGRKKYGALMKVLSRPYWRRLWILQELAMSDGSIAMGCGNRRLLFEEVVLTTKFIWHNIESFLVVVGASHAEYLSLNSSMWVILFAQQLRALSQHLEDTQCTTYAQLQIPLLNLSQNAQAKLLHDKVFGLLAIMPRGVAAEMAPYIDYTIPAETVFIAFSKTIIKYTNDLDIIFAKSYGQMMVPSWVTDWQLPPDKVSLLHDWHTYGYNQFNKAYGSLHRMIEASHKFRADGGQNPPFEILEKSHILACSGVLIGKVDGVASEWATLYTNSSNCEHVQPQHQHSPYGDDTATRRALVHTLFANPVWGDYEEAALLQIPWLSGESYPMEESDGEFFADDSWNDNVLRMHQHGWGFLFPYCNFGSFESFRRRLGRFRLGGKRFQDYFDKEITRCSLPQDRVFLDLAKVVGSYLGRRLITLTTGHFGLAPYTIEPDDVIHVILGCSLPIVLRPVAGTCHFKVVGECYVEGFSKGEAMMGLDEGKYQLQELSLV